MHLHMMCHHNPEQICRKLSKLYDFVEAHKFYDRRDTLPATIIQLPFTAKKF